MSSCGIPSRSSRSPRGLWRNGLVFKRTLWLFFLAFLGAFFFAAFFFTAADTGFFFLAFFLAFFFTAMGWPPFRIRCDALSIIRRSSSDGSTVSAIYIIGRKQQPTDL